MKMSRMFTVMATGMATVMVGLIYFGGCDADAGDVQADSEALQAAGAGRAGAGHVHCPKNVPPALNPPADATLAHAYAARGVQIYTCAAPAAGGAPAFVLKAPHAVLTSDEGVQVIHFAGPSWQALDGSLVTGTRLASAPAPDAAGIPWLLLQVASHVGAGIFTDVTTIQRLDTIGGVAPATGCDAAHLGAEILVPYRANYFFYRAAPTGGHVRQCASP